MLFRNGTALHAGKSSVGQDETQVCGHDAVQALLASGGECAGRDFRSASADRKWVSDITYIRTLEGWLHLAGVLDLYSRRVVGGAYRTGLMRNWRVGLEHGHPQPEP